MGENLNAQSSPVTAEELPVLWTEISLIGLSGVGIGTVLVFSWFIIQAETGRKINKLGISNRIMQFIISLAGVTVSIIAYLKKWPELKLLETENYQKWIKAVLLSTSVWGFFLFVATLIVFFKYKAFVSVTDATTDPKIMRLVDITIILALMLKELIATISGPVAWLLWDKMCTETIHEFIYFGIIFMWLFITFSNATHLFNEVWASERISYYTDLKQVPYA